jgi:hypothetical protein
MQQELSQPNWTNRMTLGGSLQVMASLPDYRWLRKPSGVTGVLAGSARR